MPFTVLPYVNLWYEKSQMLSIKEMITLWKSMKFVSDKMDKVFIKTIKGTVGTQVRSYAS